MLQMVHPDRVVDEAGLAKLPLVEPVYPLTEGLCDSTRCARRSMPRSTRLPDLPEWQEPDWVARERFPAFATALRTCIGPHEPADIDPGGARLDAARL